MKWVVGLALGVRPLEGENAPPLGTLVVYKNIAAAASVISALAVNGRCAGKTFLISIQINVRDTNVSWLKNA